MSDLWKIGITALITFVLTAMTLWFAMIKEHQSMCGTVESIRSSQTAAWQAIAQNGKDIASIKTAIDLFHKYKLNHGKSVGSDLGGAAHD